jgi:precorrin-2 C(20)-methyltransferase
MKKGKLYGIGVGPGDSKLMTVKAVELLQSADMIITPKTEKKDGSVAFHIASPYIPKTAEILPMVFQMNTDMAAVERQWEENRKIITEKLDEGKNLVFLTLGDPMLYSTYMYIFRAFEGTEYEAETIPGIPAFLGIASYIGMPVAEWEENVLIIPATASPEKIDRALAAADHAVIMKVYKNWGYIQSELRKHHMIKKAVMVSRAGLPDEIIQRDLDSLPADYKPNYLSTILTKRDDL